ncbi:MAG: CxxxxCH/CxxCH domain-containing protein [Desulfuromonadaceae bacterium]|nr:CxxxxCH/CxxCH domain-containing protein [Desulfuromonadaceae bacterium]MDD2855817.1 CxxxxCH/CxxCH domain-containing protein [Desulfuromonadaceae bacterium]
MNKQFLKYLAVTLLLVVPNLVFANQGSHNSITGSFGYNCGSCHILGKTIGNRDVTYSQNVCLVCHNSSSVESTKNFVKDDFANPFGTTVTVTQDAPVMNSHKWFGTDVVPAAGAQKPTLDPRAKGLLWTGYKDYLSCGRCHSVHGTSGNVESLTTPYLRADNKASDQMCRNCHAPRDLPTHTLGTHPVNVSYATAYSNNSSNYLSAPLTNTVNPTAQVKLVNGLVVCSTCHGVHNSDSDSSTFDSFTSAQTPNAKGHLLRVSPFGATANDTNICTNCHTNKTAHNTTVLSNHGVQCNDCHSGHVEFDAAANAGDTSDIPNVYLVRRYLTYSSAGRVSKRIIFNDAVNKKYYTAGGGGVCQSCHNLTPTHFDIDGTTLTRVDCAACHKHNEVTGSFRPGAGACDTCHGYPPTEANKASGYAINEDTTPHISHTNYSFNCKQCHNGSEGTGDTHNDGNFSNGEFVTKVPVSSDVLAGSNASYNGTDCSNIYCHSDGTSTTTLGSPKTVTWAGGLGTISTCDACHASVPDTGSHTFHITTISSRGYGCVTCHSTTAIDNSTVNIAGGKHVNAVKDISFSGTNPTISGSSCSAVYCHSNGKGAFSDPTWGGTAACGSCHATATAPAGYTNTSHATHFVQLSDVNNSSCTTCHVGYTETGANHVNGTVNVDSPTACASCHADPYSTDTPAPPTWGTSASGCNACHSAYSISVTGPATGAHNKHMSSTMIGGVTGGCTDCHATGTTSSTSATLLNGHADGDIDVIGTKNTGGTTDITKHSSASTLTCSTATCHADPYSVGGLVVTPSWSATSTGCAACHTGGNVITATGPATGAHNKHMTSTMLTTKVCTDCHATGTTATAAPTFANGHIDTNIDVVGTKNTIVITNITKHSTPSVLTCSTATCHADPYSVGGLVITPSWSATSTGCAACHVGGNAITATGPATGAHAKHMVTTMVGGVTGVCTDCHATGTTATTAPSLVSGHIDADIDVIGTKNTSGTTNITKHSTSSVLTCSTATCHADPYSVGGLVITPSWSATSTGCAACHTGINKVITASGPNTGSHTLHMAISGAVCIQCHATGTTATTAATFANGHADGNIDVANVGYSLEKTKGSPYTTCATASCHGTYNPPTWGASTGNALCTKCHGTPAASATNANMAPAIGAHQAHVNGVTSYGYSRELTCSECHNSSATVTFTDHMNGNIVNVVFTNASTATDNSVAAAWSGTDVNGTCTTYCHGASLKNGDTTGTNRTPSWSANLMTGTKLTDCAMCHGNPPASVAGSHGSADPTTSCTTCHSHFNATGGFDNETNRRLHIDGIVQSSGGSCNGCHGYESGSWDAAIAINPEGKGAHEAHITYLTTNRFTVTLSPASDTYGSVNPSWTNVCGVCHTGGTHMSNSVDVNISSTYLFGTTGSTLYSGTAGGSSADTPKTCSNISCHYFTTPIWSTY